MPRLACVNIDLDELVHYARIHGLSEQATERLDPVFRLACDRFGDLLAEVGLVGTAFVIGESVRDARAADAVVALAQAGHEIGNHSLSHDYRLTQAGPEVMDTEVRESADVIEMAVGVRPTGFRAPGYNVNESLLEAVGRSGHAYDSSVFPSAPYYGARAAILAAMRLGGRRSHSIPGRPQVLLAPRVPYRPDPAAFWRRGEGGLVELPISVMPGTGIPFIGTAITMLPWPLVRAGYSLLRRRNFANLELHGIDLLDAQDGIDPALLGHQPDLRIPVAEKRRRIGQILRRLRDDYEVVRLDRAAAFVG